MKTKEKNELIDQYEEGTQEQIDAEEDRFAELCRLYYDENSEFHKEIIFHEQQEWEMKERQMESLLSPIRDYFSRIGKKNIHFEVEQLTCRILAISSNLK